ncbi:outer membrane protein TolC [Elusimicrobium simillimum]|uniref:TolC family protein n=1 Tax=Elusimicrobium simillimum TaxID=3143438 RepID=UPI003C6FED56
MKKLVLPVILCLCCAYAPAQEYYSRFSPSADITLEQAIRLGLENNTKLLSSEQSILIANQRVREANFMRLPQFDLLATATHYDLEYPVVLPDAMGLRIIGPQSVDKSGDSFYGATVSAVLYLYSGGRISGTIKLAKAQLKEEQSKYETEKNNVILSVKLAFYRMLYAQKRLELTEAGYNRAKEYSKKQSNKGWQGVSVASMVEKFRIEYNNAKHEYSQAHLQMIKGLNKELNSEIKIKGDFRPVKYTNELPKMTLWAMQFRPELRTALYEVEMYDISTNITLGQKYPDIIVGGTYEQVGADSLDETNKQVSLAVRLPLSYGFLTQPKQKKAQQKQSALRRADLEDTIRLQVSGNYEAFVFWQDEVAHREEALDALTKEIKRLEGRGEYSLDSLNALDAYQKTSYSYLEAVRENLMSKSRLEWAIGQDL